MLLGPLVVQLINNQYAVFIAQTDEIATIGVMRGTYVVDTELLHQQYALLDSARVGGCT